MINCTSYKSPPLIPDYQHRTIGVADNPGGIGNKEVILQLRPVGSHDDKVAGNFIGEFENFLVHIADPDHGMGSNFGSDVFVAKDRKLVLDVRLRFFLKIVREKPPNHGHPEVRQHRRHVKVGPEILGVFDRRR